jgi:hypothetical protein
MPLLGCVASVSAVTAPGQELAETIRSARRRRATVAVVARRLLLLAAAAGAAIWVPAAAAAPFAARVELPRRAEIARGPAAFAERTATHRSLRRLAAVDTWPVHHVTVADGNTVAISLSMQYADDAVTVQRWADFFAGLLHGSELSALRAFFLTPSEVTGICGREALACYGGDELIAPGIDPGGDLSVEAVVTHEYGHHVAFNRVNDPWEAVDWGTKRWASYENVCSRKRAGTLFPGAEDQAHYTRNPGEGFAETYRVLNQRKLGAPEMPWQIVTDSLYPNARALSLLQQDVLQPWTGPTTRTVTGAVKARKTRSVVVKTPLDGTFRARVAGAGKFKLKVSTPSGRRLAAGGASATATVCGQRALRIRIAAQKTASYRLTVSTP